MHTTSELYKTLLANPLHKKEIMVDVAGVEYRENKIISLSTFGGVFTTLGIGGATSRQIDLSFFPDETPPRQAQIKIYARLCLGDDVTEWIPKGVFFTSTRATDETTGALTLHGFDAMLKASSVWLDGSYDGENWPITQAAAVQDIAKRIGVDIDSRTTLSASFLVDYPADENGDMTMMDVLQNIAVSNVGNWVISDKGELLLLRLGDLPEETFYLVTSTGDSITFGGVRILAG